MDDHRITRPIVLLAVLAVLVVGGLAYLAVSAEDGESGDDSPGALPLPLALTVEQEELAVAWAARHPLVLELTRGDSWRLHRAFPRRFSWLPGEGGANAVTLHIEWDMPVDSGGPWLLLRCRETVVHEVSAMWHDIRSVSVTVDLASGDVIEIGVGGHAVDLGAHQTDADRAGHEPADCPEGLDDEEH
jgi:hypothetical protein